MKSRKYHSELIERLEQEMKHDPWYKKLKRWINLQKWALMCRTRFIWDLSYQHNIFKKKK
jgi:hypothetical protein